MLSAHRCLEQLLIPDSRMNGATLRFWEAQYDVLMGKSRNMMDSPHGWSAWLIPALWYQYLLTGEEEWLRKTMNIMGSCAQVIDRELASCAGPSCPIHIVRSRCWSRTRITPAGKTSGCNHRRTICTDDRFFPLSRPRTSLRQRMDIGLVLLQRCA